MKNNEKWYHFVGICGSSMQGVALYLASRGCYVTGSDINNCQIAKLPNCQVKRGHSIDNINKNIDVLVYTSAVTPGSEGFVEIEQARKMGIKVLKRSELIGQLMRDTISVGVTGMHGKTTTSSMIAYILQKAGFSPSYLIGSEIKNLGNSANLGGLVASPKKDGKYVFAPKRCLEDGKSQYFVVEACEYDRSFLDMKPLVGVITNIDKEHLDYYKGGISEIKQAFKKFIKQIPKDGLLVVWQEDKYVMSLIKAAKCKVKRVSSKKIWLGLKLKLPGKHNLLNATLAAKTCHELGVDSKVIKKALNEFEGAGRRFEVMGEKNGVVVIDDYGHHPTEIRATIEALSYTSLVFSKKDGHFLHGAQASGKRSQSTFFKKTNKFENNIHFKNKLSGRKIMVFRPHQQQRTKLLFNDFVNCFKGLDKLVITDVFLIAGREKDTGENLAKKMAEEVKKQGVDAEYIGGYDSIVKWMKQYLKSGDVVVIQGATDLYKVGEQYLKRKV